MVFHLFLNNSVQVILVQSKLVTVQTSQAHSIIYQVCLTLFKSIIFKSDQLCFISQSESLVLYQLSYSFFPDSYQDETGFEPALFRVLL